MTLKQLIRVIDNYKALGRIADFEVKGISCNSKDVARGYVFVAIKGANIDGHKFIKEAVKKGARAVVVQAAGRGLKAVKGVSVIEAPNTHRALGRLASEFYGNPSLKIKVVGITGTNGKTTITYLIEALLKEAGFTPGVIGTINYRFKDKSLPSKNTTPGPVELQSMLSVMRGQKVNYAVMEASSHSLDQDRVEGVRFHSAIFTNLTQDHLDYHKTLENYFQAKLKLFLKLEKGSFAVVNDDDKYGNRIKDATKAEVVTYSMDKAADVTAKYVRSDVSGTKFTVSGYGREIKLKTGLIGRHNVYNILAAVAWALREGLTSAVIKSAVSKLNLVPGRLERIDSRAGFSVFVDYAHTQDALENVIGTLEQLPHKSILVVFGAGGDRDKTKRPKMGKVVTELADYAVITSDNPRSEDPKAIIEDIKRGIRRENFCVFPDRRIAIEKALSMANPGDIVLIAGKGHETYQVLKNKTIHFDDREVVRECLRSMNY